MARKILIIEDYPETRQMLADLMKINDFEPMEARDAIEGIEKAKSGQPDLILLDVMLPMMDGVEACRKLKSDPKTAKIPVIFVTVKQIEEGLKVGEEIGADAYIKKPFDPDELLEIVRVILEKPKVK